MGIARLRKMYSVPAKVGGMLEYTDMDGHKWKCKILSCNDAMHLHVRTEPHGKSLFCTRRGASNIYR